jgi:hypothetical protein
MLDRNAFCSGAIITAFIVQLPQRFVLVNDLSTIQAGIRLLPFAAVIGLTCIIMSFVFSESKIPVLYWLLFGGLLQVAGAAGLSKTSTDPDIDPAQYGFQVLAGAGVGVFNVGLILLTPRIVSKKHLGT